MNHLILTFDQVSASMFILKDNMIKGTTAGIAIIKELDKMAADVEGARTGFIAADNKGSTLFRGDDSSGAKKPAPLPDNSNAKIKETEHTGIANGENKVKGVLEKGAILGPGLLMANDFVYGIANNGSTLLRGKDLDNQVKTDIDRQDAFMSEVKDVGGLAVSGEVKAADVRDISIWISIGKVISKNGSNIVKLTEKQRLQVYKRVSAVIRIEGHDGIYTDEFKFIEEDIDNIDYSKSILDIEG